MLKAFDDIKKARGWNDTGMEKVLNNIHSRLKRRLPDGVEPSLTKFQKKAIASENFWRDWSRGGEPEHLMVQGATSAGKTLLSELNIIDTLRHEQKAIVLVPLKAMVHERTMQFREDLGHGSSEYDISVYGSSGDYMENDEQLINGEYDVAIIVYEKFFAMISQGNTKIMDDCGLLVVDELSMLGSEQRGSKLEMALEIVRAKHTDTRIMCLATCDCSTERVCRWLNIEGPIISTARPIALEEHILELNGNGMYRIIPADHEYDNEDEAPEAHSERIVIPNYNSEWRTHEKERNLLLPVISEIYRDNPNARVLVFVSTQARSAEIAEFLKKSIDKWSPAAADSKDASSEFLNALKACERDEGQEKLIDELIPYGIAYHNAGISTTLRELIEGEFSKPRSSLRVIVATETLTVGVNMPFDAMIMLSNLVPRGMGKLMPLTMQEYRNYIGRAGRLGQSNRIGKTYLFVEKSKDRDKYWKSYYNRDEVTSALTEADSEILAPYYLSLLNNRLVNVNRRETRFNLDQITTLFNQSWLKICGNKKFNAGHVREKLYSGYLASDILCNSGPVPRGAVAANEYAIEDFGSHMAPFAFSIDTCVKIFWYFYEGYKHGGLPLGITAEDIESDRYLLDILYHVCCHNEIVESSNLMYPTDNNLSKSYSAKRGVLEQLRVILSEKDENGEPKNLLWCDAHGSSSRENNDIWSLLNKSNLPDERLKLQAAMRAIILFYWTRGLTVMQIREITKFHTFCKLITGDVERLAEAVSFHLDAIQKCLKYVTEPESNLPVYKDTEALKAFYALHTRVRYGMSRELVLFANKHIHGLDRRRLLEIQREAERNGLTPLQYLYITPPERISERILTPAQHNQLIEALERRGENSSINTFMEILENDMGTSLTSEQLECLKGIIGWGDTEEKESADPKHIYRFIKNLKNNPALRAVDIGMDGSTCNIVWRVGSLKIHVGVLDSEKANDDVLEFFRDEAASKVLLVPHSFTEEQFETVFRIYSPNAIFDNGYFAAALAKAIHRPVDEGLALTEMLADLRGVFRKFDYSHLPLRRYLRREKSTCSKYYLLYGNTTDKRFEGKLTTSSLEAALRESEDLKNFEILPWGGALFSEEYDFTAHPTVIFLSRADITHSESLSKFIFKMRNQNRQFGNCVLILESDAAEEEWNSRSCLEGLGVNNWNLQYNKIRKDVVTDLKSAITSIRTFIGTWSHPGYLIGISYAHYDSQQSEARSGSANDVELISRLANELASEYGEDLILFDRFEPAKRLFDENRGQDKSLEAYKSCRFYLILWNYWTAENKNCRAERDIIIERCKDDSNKCMFLQTGDPADPPVPNGYFAKDIREDNIDELACRIKGLVDELLS